MKDIIKAEWLEGEEWKHYDYHYYISNMGRAYSTFRDTILKPQHNPNGYYTIFIKGKTTRIHRLVAILFIPNDDPNKNIVDHINNNKLDNRAINLQWCTMEFNTLKAIKDGLIKDGLFKIRETVEIDENDVIIGRWNSLKDCYRDTGIPFRNISKVCLGVISRTSGRRFRYV